MGLLFLEFKTADQFVILVFCCKTVSSLPWLVILYLKNIKNRKFVLEKVESYVTDFEEVLNKKTLLLNQ